ncbi:hypothetical protein CVT26_007199 [Gymnopilus dilepis]|uniref:RFX-type winged-helix domain-containing protein n=1 Tax=Gymnopilus dilepis TaxID=231916 RepID=A0A409W064_9AGAR|nr:hypothetical protein CVT26_007199 [Gymnopilus dilepis]
MDKRFNLNNYRPAGQRRGEGSSTGNASANTNTNATGGPENAGVGSKQIPRTGTAKSAALINQTPRAGTSNSSGVKPRPFISPKLASRVAQAQATPGGVSQTPRATAGAITTTPASRAATGPLVGPGTSGNLLGSRKSPFKRFGSPSKVRVQVGNSTSSTSSHSHSQATMSFGTSLGKPVFGVNRQTPPNNIGAKQMQFPARTSIPSQPQPNTSTSTSKASSSRQAPAALTTAATTSQAPYRSLRHRKLTEVELNHLNQFSEPTRSQLWLKATYEYTPSSQIPQLDIWSLYKGTFASLADPDPVPGLLKPTDLITSVSSVFPGAEAQLIEGQFVVTNIARRGGLEAAEPGGGGSITKAKALIPKVNPVRIPSSASVGQDSEIVEVDRGFFVERLPGGSTPKRIATASELGLYGSNHKGPKSYPGGAAANPHLYTNSTNSDRSTPVSAPVPSVNGNLNINGNTNSRRSSMSMSTTSVTVNETRRASYSTMASGAGAPSSLMDVKELTFGSGAAGTSANASSSNSGSVLSGVQNANVLDVFGPVLERLQDALLEKLDARMGLGGGGKAKGKGKERAIDVDMDVEGEQGAEGDQQMQEENSDEGILKALGILAERMKDIGRDVKTIGRDVGVLKAVLGVPPHLLDLESSRDGSGHTLAGRRKKRRSSVNQDQDTDTNVSSQVQGRSVLERLDSIEMDVQEWLERLRDPMAGVEEGVIVVEDSDDEGEVQNEQNVDGGGVQGEEVPPPAAVTPHPQDATEPEAEDQARIPTPSPVIRRDMATSPMPIQRAATPPPPPAPVIVPQASTKITTSIGINTTPQRPLHLPLPPQPAQQKVHATLLIPVPTIPIGLNISPERANERLSVQDLEERTRERRKKWKQMGDVPRIRGFEGEAEGVDVGDVEASRGADKDVDMMEENKSVSSLSSLTSTGAESDPGEESQGTDDDQEPEQRDDGLSEQEDETEIQIPDKSKLQRIVDSDDGSDDDKPLGPDEDIFGPYRPNTASLASSSRSTPVFRSVSPEPTKMKRSFARGGPASARASPFLFGMSRFILTVFCPCDVLQRSLWI